MAEETVVENETEAATNPSESSRFNEEDVQVVAKTAAELVQQALGQHEKAIEHTSVYGHSLMEMASDELEILAAGKSADNVEATHKIATLLAGALAVDRLKCPAAVDRHAIAQQAHDLMESATISDGFSHDFCEAHAIGIRAAQASQRKPTYTPEQYRLILEVIAGRMDTLRRLAMQAQGSDEYLSAVALDAVEVIAAYVGSLADEATGCSIIGDADYWNYGPNFKNSEEVQHG